MTETQSNYRVALNFCGSLILRIGNFLCFAGTNWKTGRLEDWKIGRTNLEDWFFLLRIKFCDFLEVAFK